jgi:hypothetical protein
MGRQTMNDKSGRKNRFVRANVPAVERIGSAAVLVLLAAIAGAVAIKGRHYDPDRFSLDPAFLAATRSDPGLPAVAPGPGAGSFPAEETAGIAGGEEDALTLPLDSVAPLGPTEHYTPDTLYEKINGQAEGYLSFDFRRLRCRTFGLPGGAGAYIDVYEYDMGEPINAYGIFALERDPAAPAIDYAAEGYRAEMGVFLRQGRCYVQVLASDPEPATMSAADAAARAMAAAVPVDDHGLEGLKNLPAGGDPSSLIYIRQDAFGIPGLVDVFQAAYDVDGVNLTFFVSAQPDAATAAAVYNEYLKFARQFGNVSELAPTGDHRVFANESFGQWNVIYQRGSEIGGAVNTADRATAERMVREYLEGTLALPPFSGTPATKRDASGNESAGDESYEDAY